MNTTERQQVSMSRLGSSGRRDVQFLPLNITLSFEHERFPEIVV